MKTLVLTGDKIELARLAMLKAMLKLEIAGMHRRGRSAYSILKSEYALKGSKQKVLSQIEGLLNAGVSNEKN